MNLSVDYFTAKRTQKRSKTADVSGKVFEAVEIATKVLRLCYPLRTVKATKCYFNNHPVEPFLRPEHPGLDEGHDPKLKKFTQQCKEYVVVDVYFLFASLANESEGEKDAFAVEVAFPVGVERVRWNRIVRVRWADLGFHNQGNHSDDQPVPELLGETFVNNWL